MSQTTLAYRVRKSKPTTTKTEQTRSYPKRERKHTPSTTVPFTAQPLDYDNPVLQPLGDVSSKENKGAKQRSKEKEGATQISKENQEARQRSKENLGVRRGKEQFEKSPGKRLCIEPPGKEISDRALIVNVMVSYH